MGIKDLKCVAIICPLHWQTVLSPRYGGGISESPRLAHGGSFAGRRGTIRCDGISGGLLATRVRVSGLIKVGDLSIADRYPYLPSVGVFIVFAWGIAELTSRWVGRPIPLAIGAAAILISCAVVAGRQVPYWQNPQSLFEHASAVTGKNALADINLGFYFSQNREWERAREHYQSAIAADPDFAEAWNGLGYVFFEEKKYDDAIAQCGTALQLKPDYADARNNLGNALFCVGKTNEAMEQFREAVRLKPQEAIGHYNLGY